MLQTSRLWGPRRPMEVAKPFSTGGNSMSLLSSIFKFCIIFMYLSESDQILLNFYTDIVNTAAFDTPVAFLQKYSDIDNYGVVVESEERVRKLMCQIVGKNIEKASQIVEYLSGEEVDQRISPFLAKIISNKLPDIRSSLLRRQISRGCPTLLDNNWRIINVQTTNWNAKTNKILLNLTLTIEQTNRENEPHRQIALEMNIHEVQSFLQKLREIKRSLRV